MASIASRRFLALAAGLALTTTTTGAAPRPAGDLLDLVPADALGVAVVQWNELRSSSMYRQCEERYAFGHDRMAFDDVARLTGIDPGRDVDSAMVAVCGASEGDGVLGILAGRFDQAAIAKALAAKAQVEATIDEKSGTRIFRLEPPGGRATSLAFARDGLLVFGDSARVETAVASLRDSRLRLPADAGLRQAFDGAPRTGQVWGAVALDRVTPLLKLPDGGGPSTLAALKALRWASFNAEFGADLSLTVSGACRSSEEADLVRQALDGMLALGKLGAQDRPEVLALLAETTVDRAGDRVTFHTLINRDLLRVAAEIKEEGRAGSARPR